MGVDNNRRVLGDVAGSLLGATLHDKRTESSQIDILLVLCKALADFLHEGFHCRSNILFCNTCLVSNFVDDFCLCPFLVLSYFYILIMCKSDNLRYRTAKLLFFSEIPKYFRTFFKKKAFFAKY